MAIRLIVDSTTDIGAKDHEKCVVVPLSVTFGEREYVDGVNLTKDEFYDKLENSQELPHTSQASPATFQEIFEKITSHGDEAVVLAVSSKLSGTCQSAMIAAEDFDNIRVVDSLNVTIGAGILAAYALGCIEEGMGLDEICEALEEKKKQVRLVARLDTLEYLQKGGRISKTAAIAGSMLNVKPVVTVSEGEIALMGKARGSKKANNFLNEAAKKSGINYELPVLLGYSGQTDEMLQDYINSSKSLWEEQLGELDVVQIGTVVGTHAGPGGVAVAFFADH